MLDLNQTYPPVIMSLREKQYLQKQRNVFN